MGWRIGLIKNTVQVPQSYVPNLFEYGELEGLWYDEEDVLEDGLLTFDDDHMEHMDYVWHPGILSILAEAKVNGEIAFSSVDGDNAGKWWKYTFTNGECTKTVGKLSDLI
jgi:hypothetical protein